MEHHKTFILTESATDKFIDKLIYNNLPENAKPFFDMPVNEIMEKHPEALDNVALNGNEEVLKRYGNMKLKDFIRVAISQMFDINRNKGPKRYMRGIFRIMLDEIKCLRNPDMNSINQLKDDVMYIMQASDNGSDKDAMALDGNLNGLSLSQLNTTFKEKRKAFFANIRDRLSSSFGKNSNAPRYKKVSIMSHEDAMRFAPYVGWCITFDNPSNYDTYIQGGRRFYVFLREGFENVRRSAGENCPFDDYGMSMVSILVDMDGNISIITTRWNHDHDGELNPPSSDQVKMVMDMMGVNLYRECPPYSREELKAIGIVPFDEVQDMLDSGMKPKEIFDRIDYFHEGFAKVQLNGKFNFIDTSSNLLSEQWYDGAGNFSEGFAKVWSNGKFNFIDTKGKLLSEQWYDYAYDFCNGFARVKLNGKRNFIDTKGNLQSEQWYEDVYSFSEGFAKVKLDDKFNYIDTEGKLLSEQWYDYACDFSEGFAKVWSNEKWNFIDTSSNLLSEQWYDGACSFCNGFAEVEIDDKWNFIDTSGNLLSEQWYEDAYSFSEGFAKVKLDDKWYCINKNGWLCDYITREPIRDVSAKGRSTMGEEKSKSSKTFILTEEQAKALTKSRILLTESATDKFIDKLIYNNLPENAKQFFDMPVNEIMEKHPEALDNVAINGNEEVLKRYGNMKLKDFIRVAISQMFDINRNKGPKRYMRGIFRIMLDEIKCLRNPDMNSINQLKDDVMYIMQASDNGYDKDAMALDGNLNGLSLSQLNSTFKEKRKAFFANIRNRLSSSFGKNSNAPKYKKVPIMSHKDAMRFAPYVKWCITFDNPSNYDTYTQGGRRFYVFLREGFENVRRSASENCPFDDYGMSMVSILVDMDGNISIITTRWNHDHDGELNPPSSDQVKIVMDMMGVNLYRECPPYSREELKSMGIVPFDEVQDMLDSGMKPNEIFNWIDDFHEGFAKVQLNGKWNFIDTKGKLLSEQWYDFAYDFSEGFSLVKLNGKWNFIDTEGKRLSEQWYESAGNFHEGFAVVILNGKWNYIDTEGKILSERWYEDAGNFSEGFAVVKLDGKWNYIDMSGKLLSEQWYDYAYDFCNGFAPVNLNGKFNFIDTKGKLLSSQWYEDAYSFSEGFAGVKLNGNFNFIDTKGKLLSEQWYDSAWNFSEGFATVRLGDKLYKIDKNGWLCDCYTKEPIRDVSAKGRFTMGEERSKGSKTFILTENQAYTLLLEALTKNEVWEKYYKNIDKNIFDAIIKADPTSKGDHAGKFVKWIVELFKNGRWKPGDTNETKSTLERFAKFGQRIPQNMRDINKYKSVGELYDIVNEYCSDKSREEIQKEIKSEGAEKVYEDTDWTVIIPKTKEAAILYGKGTEWCTAAERSGNFFEHYNSQGPLYIIIPKNDSKHKFQFHFETNSFMDETDNPINSLNRLSKLGKTDGLFQFLEKLDGNFVLFPMNRTKKFMEAVADGSYKEKFEVTDLTNKWEKVKVGNRYFILDGNKKILGNGCFTDVSRFYDGLLKVEYNIHEFEYSYDSIAYDDNNNDNIRVNYISYYTEMFIFDDSDAYLGSRSDDFNDGYAVVELYDTSFEGIDGAGNLLDKNGDLLFPIDYNVMGRFGDKVIISSPNDKYNIFSLSQRDYIYGELDDDWTWLDDITPAGDGFILRNRDKNGVYQENATDVYGNVLSDRWFTKCMYAGERTWLVKQILPDGEVKCNYLEESGKLMIGDINNPETWFDSCDFWYFNRETGSVLANVQYNGGWYFYTRGGSFLNAKPFENIYYPLKGKSAAVRSGNKVYFVDININRVSPYFDRVLRGKYNYVLVYTNDLYYCYDTDEGKLLNNNGAYKMVITYGMDDEDFIHGELKPGLYFIMDKYGNIRLPYIDRDKIEYPGNISLKQTQSNESKTMNKNILKETIEEVEPDEISLDSFKIMDNLCPELWKNGELDPKVRLKLLDIADDFVDTLNIKWVKPEDIYFTGSLANYNWSSFSDIDLHIVYDYKKIYDKPEFVENYMKSKKQIWNDQHKDLTIMDFPVEVGVEDTNTPLDSSGIYSLESAEWIKTPKMMSDEGFDREYVKYISSKIMTKADDLGDVFYNTDDSVVKSKIAERISSIIEELKDKRKKGLKRKGEMDSDNIIYKIIRRSGYFDKMREIVNRGYDAENSINEGIEEFKVNDFDTDTFAGLSFAKKVQYCKQHFGNPIGNGSSRMVFNVGDGKVLKLAKNKKGLAQNMVEIESSGWYDYGDMFPQVFEADEENGTYIISEFAERAKKSTFKQKTGIDYDTFCRFCIGFEEEYKPSRWGSSYQLSQDDYDFIEDNDTLQSFYSYISNCQPYNVREIIALRNLGFVKRDGDETLVIIDAGFDEDVAKEYYTRH